MGGCRRWVVLAGCAALTMSGCGVRPHPGAMSSPAANQRNVTAPALGASPLMTRTLPPVGPYRPGAASATASHPALATLAPADLAGLAPGTRHLVFDYTSGTLSAYAFTKIALAKIGQAHAVSVPARYQDPAALLTRGDQMILAAMAQGTARLLTPAERAQLAKEAGATPEFP